MQSTVHWNLQNEYSSAPILCCLWHIYTGEYRVSNWKWLPRPRTWGVNTKNCSLRASIPKVEKIQISGQPIKGQQRNPLSGVLFGVISQWAFQGARSRINIFQSTMNHTWVPKEAWSTFHPLRKTDEIYFPGRGETDLFLHARINRAAESSGCRGWKKLKKSHVAEAAAWR